MSKRIWYVEKFLENNKIYDNISEDKMGRKQHQGDKLWLTTQEWKYFFGGKKPNRKTDPEEVSELFDS